MKLTGEHLFERFKTMFPEIANRVVEWERCSQFEISIVLDDDTTVVYDDAYKTISAAKPETYDISEDDFQHEFAKRLTDKLVRSGMTQMELSEATGISRQSIGRYINGSAMPSLSSLISIAKALNCQPSEFID
jgi:DNA-binding XRE family transcriptional regulator